MDMTQLRVLMVYFLEISQVYGGFDNTNATKLFEMIQNGNHPVSWVVARLDEIPSGIYMVGRFEGLSPQQQKVIAPRLMKVRYEGSRSRFDFKSLSYVVDVALKNQLLLGATLMRLISYLDNADKRRTSNKAISISTPMKQNQFSDAALALAWLCHIWEQLMFAVYNSGRLFSEYFEKDFALHAVDDLVVMTRVLENHEHPLEGLFMELGWLDFRHFEEMRERALAIGLDNLG